MHVDFWTLLHVPGLPNEVALGKLLLGTAFVNHSSFKGHRLVIILQHCIYGGWSRALFRQELERAYTGLPLQSRPLPSSNFTTDRLGSQSVLDGEDD